MKHYSNLFFCLLLLLFGTGLTYGNTGLETISLPQSYQGTAGFKVSGVYHSSISLPEIGGNWHDYRETIEESGKINALLVGNFLIYMPSIDKPLVTGTVYYNHCTYRNGNPLMTNTAPVQNITSQNLQGAIELYLDYTKKTYTLSIGLGAEGESTHFVSPAGQIQSPTKKRFELEKVELTIPLPKDLKFLKGSKTISVAAKTPDSLHQVIENKKTIEIAWEFVASPVENALPKQIIDQAGQNAKQ